MELNLDGKNTPLNTLENLKKENGILFSYLNINSLRNKTNSVNKLILNHVDILCLAETKLDSSFPEGQFGVLGFKNPIRLDFNKNSGGLLLYARNYLPLRQLKCNLLLPGTECLVLELNLRNSKWLILSIYRNPSLQNLRLFLDEITKVLDHYSALYENLLIFGDFNEEPSNRNMLNFLESFSLKSLINEPTCFKSKDGRCIDLILTNRPLSFKKSGSLETGISDYHHLIFSMFKSNFKKAPPKLLNIDHSKILIMRISGQICAAILTVIFLILRYSVKPLKVSLMLMHQRKSEPLEEIKSPISQNLFARLSWFALV